MDFNKKFAVVRDEKKSFLEQKKREKQLKEELKVKAVSVSKISAFWRFQSAKCKEFAPKLLDIEKKLRDVKLVKQQIPASKHAELSNKMLISYSVFFDVLRYITYANS